MERPTQELEELRALALVAEAEGVFLHELGNELNGLTLGMALLHSQVPAPCQAKVAELRQTARNLGELMHQVRRCEDSQRLPAYPLALEEIVRTLAQEWTQAGTSVQLDLPPALPTVLGTVTDIRLLLTLLRRLVESATGTLPSLRLQAEVTEGRLRLGITSSEEAKSNDGPPATLMRALAQRVLRRLRGSLEEPSPANETIAAFAFLPVAGA